MAEIINLRSRRKAVERLRRTEIAAANRAKHGRTRDEKAREVAERSKLETALDGARRDAPHRPTDPETPT